MFIVTYRYSIPPEKARDYIALEQKAIQIYIEHGCLGVELYKDPQNPRKWMEINNDYFCRRNRNLHRLR